MGGQSVCLCTKLPFMPCHGHSFYEYYVKSNSHTCNESSSATVENEKVYKV